MMRRLAAALCALLAGPACAQESLRVGIASNTWTFAPLQVGIDHGQFAAHGLRIEPLVFAGAARLQQAMVGGAADIALSGSTDFAYLVKGAPEIVVGGFVRPPMGLGLIVADPAIRTVGDLKGRRIGVSSPSALTGWLAMELARSQGWPPEAIQLVSLGGVIAAQGAALVTGQVEAIFSDAALGYMLEQKGQGRVLLTAASFAPDFLTNVILAAKSTAATRPGAVRAFLAAWFDAVGWMQAHRAETVASARAITGLDESVVGREYDESLAMFTRGGAISTAELARVATAIADTGLTDRPADLGTYYSGAFLPPAASQ